MLTKPEAKTATLKRVIPTLLVCLFFVLDLVIDFILSRRKGERTTRPTRRTRSIDRWKPELHRGQNGRCMYCGVRRRIEQLEMDHMVPVERNGSNDFCNLQLLCKPCNARKGIHTDQEFRRRYQELVPMTRRNRRLEPPQRTIPQREFRRVTQETDTAEGVRDFRATKYITPRQKLTSGTAIAGLVGGVGWMMIISLLLPDHPIVVDVAVWGGMAIGIMICAALLLRAKHTGKFDQ